MVTVHKVAKDKLCHVIVCKLWKQKYHKDHTVSQ